MTGKGQTEALTFPPIKINECRWKASRCRQWRLLFKPSLLIALITTLIDPPPKKKYEVINLQSKISDSVAIVTLRDILQYFFCLDTWIPTTFHYFQIFFRVIKTGLGMDCSNPRFYFISSWKICAGRRRSTVFQQRCGRVPAIDPNVYHCRFQGRSVHGGGRRCQSDRLLLCHF